MLNPQVKCPGCRNEFTSESFNVPYSLPCGHSICYLCLTQENRDTRCPSCQGNIPTGQPSVKNFGLIDLISSIAQCKNATVCSNCKGKFTSIKKEMLLCVSCSIDQEPGWMDKPDAEENCLNHGLCRSCVEAHSDHSVKSFSELQNVLAASHCSGKLAANVCSLYSQVQSFIADDHKKVQSVEQTIGRAISFLKNSKAGDDLDFAITRDFVAESIQSVKNSLFAVLDIHRENMKAIEIVDLEIQERLPGDHSSENIETENEGILKIRNTLNTIVCENEERLTSEFLNCNVSSDKDLLHEAIHIFTTKTVKTIENSSLRPQIQLYARVCKAQMEADHKTPTSRFRDLLFTKLKNDFLSFGTTIDEEEKSLMISIINGADNSDQLQLMNKLGEIFLKPRTRMLGVMRFITELVLHKVFSHKMMTSFLSHITSTFKPAAAPFSISYENFVMCICDCLDMIQSSDCDHEIKATYGLFVCQLKKGKYDVSKSTRKSIKNLCEKWELKNSQIENGDNLESDAD